ncbi:OapC/ArvC family zinc-ribbon domain-containing protein [Natrarchaeobius oligotrophus]|uniref:Origin-associated protein OapC n=1 Tax=Natrarchaeobius chitinivorans TaxID=1679083 RepID=A0A3N6MSU4_NATCH|nr:Zn-ribbon containing protein [Natrarchaeobius chitinivorans]RQH00901.1 hypothetical protein EA472_09770 [Natrarchaeobius chitinivorans]
MPHECTNCGRTFPDGSKEMLSGCPDCGGNKFQFTPASPSSGVGSESPSPDRPTAGDDATSTDPSFATDDTAASDRASRSGSPRGRSDAANRLEKSDVSTREWPETARRPEDRSSATDDAESGSPSSSRNAPTSTSSGSRPPASDSSWISGTGNSSSDDDSVDRSTLAETEESAQADARSEMISNDELPPVSGSSSKVDDTPHARSDAESEFDTDSSTDTSSGGESEPTVDTGTDPAPERDDHDPEHGRVVSEPSGEKPSIDELREELNEQFESIKIVSPGQYELNLMELYNREEYIISLQEDGRYVIDVPDSWRDGDG